MVAWCAAKGEPRLNRRRMPVERAADGSFSLLQLDDDPVRLCK